MPKYIIYKQLGSGSFGNVFLSYDKDGNPYATKIEELQKNKKSRLKFEFEIYKYLFKCGFIIGIPKVYDYIQLNDYNLLIMELLGKSLEEKFNECRRKFQICTILRLGIDITSLISNLHSCGFIHRDIKPANFLFSRNNEDVLNLIDLGLSKRYLDNNKHIKYHDDKPLIGTARYISINIHLNIEPSRRDDLESVGYMLVYFMKGKLPWQGIHTKNQIKDIGDIKMCTSVQKLCSDLPICILKYINYCRMLKFEEQPDYEYLKGLFKHYSEEIDIVPKYEWI